MKLSGFVKQVIKTVDHELKAQQAHRPAARRAAAADGFERAARPTPVNLGKLEPASKASDTEFVKGLYRDLLHREPDTGGLAAHLSGLANGMSRDAIKQVFLSSPELRALQNAPAAPTAPAAPEQKTGVEQLKQLISADIKTASGREATQADFDYWLPKLQEPCDSGFVTSGQMTGVEYYHRRMLGWQAGGADMATQGPYAGSPEARGPVPSATDVVGPIDAGTIATTPASSGGPSDAALRALINADMMASGGRPANDADYNYWLPMLKGPCDSGYVTSGQMTGVEYYHRRMLGWQAGGADLATQGPYAGSPDARGPVPSATDVMGQLGVS
jgi:hypothetical protein